MEKKNILFASHPDYSGNSKALYEYMKKKCPEFNLFWVAYDDKKYITMKENNILCYKYGSEEFNDVFKNVDLVFFTHDELLDMKQENQKFVYLGHGNSGKKTGYFLNKKQMAIQDKNFLMLMKENIDFIISPSELWNVLYHVTHDFDMNRILSLGTPRTDFIYTENGKENLKKCGIDVSKYKKVLMYLPTFRNGLGRQQDGKYSSNLFNIKKYNEEELEEFLVKNNYLLIVKYHPYELNKRDFKDLKNVVVLQEVKLDDNLISLTEIINGVDLIIADYFSAFSDFVILNKPVCFLNEDLEIYKKNRGIIFDDINFWSPGPYIKTIKNLKVEIQKLLSDSNYYKKERDEYVLMHFNKNVKNCSQNVVNYLFYNKNFNIFEYKNKKIDNEKINLYKENLKLLETKEEQKNEINRLNSDLNIYKDLLIKKEKELNDVYSSKRFKIIDKIANIFTKIRGKKRK